MLIACLSNATLRCQVSYPRSDTTHIRTLFQNHLIFLRNICRRLLPVLRSQTGLVLRPSLNDSKCFVDNFRICILCMMRFLHFQVIEGCLPTSPRACKEYPHFVPSSFQSRDSFKYVAKSSSLIILRWLSGAMFLIEYTDKPPSSSQIALFFTGRPHPLHRLGLARGHLDVDLRGNNITR